MTCNNLLTLLFVSALSACSVLPMVQDNKTAQINDEKVEVSTEVLAKDRQAVSVETEKQASTVAPIKDGIADVAQSLISQTDLFVQSKSRLSPETREQVVVALTLFNEGQFKASQKAINKVIQNALNLNSSVYVLAGDIALANAEPSKAEKYYQQALNKNEYNAKAANRLAKIKREKGEFADSERLYTQAIHAQPAHAQSYRNRAVLYDLYLQEKVKALADYEVYSALLEYQFKQHETADNTNISEQIEDRTNNTIKGAKLKQNELTVIDENMTLVKRWIIDVGRQVAAQQSAKDAK